jgi:hypothetical protein
MKKLAIAAGAAALTACSMGNFIAMLGPFRQLVLALSFAHSRGGLLAPAAFNPSSSSWRIASFSELMRWSWRNVLIRSAKSADKGTSFLTGKICSRDFTMSAI